MARCVGLGAFASDATLFSYSIMLPAEIYCDARSRFVELVRGLPQEMHDRWVPACPQWSVRDIVAHLAGASADFIESNFPAPGVPFECWTATQVAKREGRSLEELLAEWDELASTIVTMMRDGRVPEGPLINDVATHEQDVRGALGKPGGRDAPGYALLSIASWEDSRTRSSRRSFQRWPCTQRNGTDT
jgi:uncharacterized protein (TIGR03083 family)